MRKTITRRPGERGFYALFAAIICLWTIQLTLVVGGIVVALHFILKYW